MLISISHCRVKYDCFVFLVEPMSARLLLPLFGGGHRPRILRVLTAAPSPDVIEMTLIVAAGPRTRAVAVRLERSVESGPPETAGRKTARPWLCTDIEAA